jgi:hypothetical protein
MPDRRSIPWLAGLLLLAVVATGLATGLVVWASDMYVKADEFYRSLTGEEIAPAVSEYWDRQFTMSHAIRDFVPPLFVGALLAVLTVLAVLARQWRPVRR